MVTTAGVIIRIEGFLNALEAALDDLPDAAGEWPDLSSEQQADFSLDWAHLMADYLSSLDEYYRDGRMPADQEQRYRDVRQRLENAAPLIDRLSLYPPPVSMAV